MVKQVLKIFNPQTYTPVYQLPAPDGWGMNVFHCPWILQSRYPLRCGGCEIFPGWEIPRVKITGLMRIYGGWREVWILKRPSCRIIEILFCRVVKPEYHTRKIPAEKLYPVNVSIKNVKTAAGDIKTFEGTVNMLNYIIQEPMVLNIIIHQKYCPDKTHSFVLFEVSPKHFNHANWEKLNKLNADFSCTK